MSNTSDLASIQYQLSMAIELNSQPKSIIQSFSKVCLPCLNLDAIHTYFYNDDDLIHINSYPENLIDQLPHNDPMLIQTLSYLSSTQEQPTKFIENSNHYHIIPLKSLGFMIFERKVSPLSDDLIDALLPILSRLSQSCLFSIEYEHNLQNQQPDNASANSHTLYKSLFDNVVDGIITTNKKGVIQTFNPAAEKIFGYLSKEIIGKSITTLMPKAYRKKHKQYINIHQSFSGINSQLINRKRKLSAQKKGGKTFPVEIIIHELYLDKEHVFSTIVRDITQQKQMKNSLERQLKQTQSVTHFAQIMTSEKSYDKILQELVSMAGKTLEVDQVLVYGVSFDVFMLTALSEWSHPEALKINHLQSHLSLNISDKDISCIRDKKQCFESHAKSIKPHVISDASKLTLHQTLKTQSLLWVPFKFTKNGCLILALHQTRRHREWRKEEKSFIKSVFYHVEAALKKTEILNEKDQAEQDLRLAATAFETHDAIFIANKEGYIQRVNQAFCQITGFSESEIINQLPSILYSQRHDEPFYRKQWNAVIERGHWQGEVWSQRKNGDIYPQWETITAVKDKNQNITHFVSTFQDITERKNSEAKIARLAYYDTLTNLPNRTMLLKQLNHELSQALRNNQLGALLFLDLDRFKMINDALGHSFGDDLLKQVGQRLLKQVRTGDTVSRLGGDEFVILLPNLDLDQDQATQKAHVIAEKIRTALEHPYILKEHEYQFTPSTGIALFPTNGNTADDVLKHADAAMYQAKGAGRNTIRIYQSSMQTAADERLALEKDLRSALQHNELSLYFQPQVNSLGKITGAEALLRWQHSEKGSISPSTFIPVAEETGQIISIGKWVLKNAALYAKKWHQEKLCPASNFVAVNVSPRQFCQYDFVSHYLQIIENIKALPSCLKVELTENVLMMDVEETIKKMNQLRALGVHLSIDDFGTGYSSLTYLKRLPLNQLKIDQSFIRDLSKGSKNSAIVEAIITMSRHLGLEVIAEGVETEEELCLLQTQNCNLYQGYYFSHPVPADAFEKLLQIQSTGTPPYQSSASLDLTHALNI